MNKQGSGLLAILVAIVATVGSTGLFAASNSLQGGIVGGYSALVVYSQMPHVVNDFRVKKAVRQCKANGGIHCETSVGDLTEEEIMDYIKDDEIAYMGNGGNFTNGYMN